MRLSMTYLKEMFALDINAQTLAQTLTMAGLEVDSVEAMPAFSNIVIGEVKTLEPHPDADKLRIATVDVAQGAPLSIVCGAPNVAVGIRIPVALIGATLPDGLKIKRSKLRGVESFGMLCSARELGLSEDHSGLWILPKDAPIGMDIRQYLSLDDQVLDIDLTPNRADCFSYLGLAREAAVLLGKNDPTHDFVNSIKPTQATQKPTRNIRNLAPQACAKYLACEIDNIDNTGTTPIWMSEFLRRAGVRTHSPVVDITNYVMMVLGTPLHAFDQAKFSGDITIRMAEKGEKLSLLNEQEATLNEQVLVIADAHKAQAIAGVMGGAESACNEATQSIILESAWFHPVTIAGKARMFGLSSDSAQRFERGVDFSLQAQALHLASKLIAEICGGRASEVIEWVDNAHLPVRSPIVLRLETMHRRLGKSYDIAQVKAILSALGCRVEDHLEGVQATPPTWRFDMTMECDLIEEIARVDGYHNIEPVHPKTVYQKDESPLPSDRLLREKLISAGAYEAITYAFVDPNWQGAFFKDHKTLRLKNPISALLSEMRLSLIPGLVSALVYNRNRQQSDSRLFEFGKVFMPKGEAIMDCTQEERFAFAFSGVAMPELWANEKRALDFFDIKGVVETLIPVHKTADFTPSELGYLHPGQSATLYLDGEKVGDFGALHPELLKELGIKGQGIWVAEFSLSHLIDTRITQVHPIAKFPSIRRDLALVVNKNVSTQTLKNAIMESGGDNLQEIIFFDRYEGDSLGENKYSLALGLIFQNQEKTLQDNDVEAIISSLIDNLHQTCGAYLR